MLFAAPARADEYDTALALDHARTHAPTVREREIAQFDLAVHLHEIGLRHAAYTIFYAIAHERTHARHREALPWLARIAFELGEPADVVEAIGAYDDATIDALVDESARWALYYLRGRYEYRNHRYDAALRYFAKVDPRSAFHRRAQIQSGLAHVAMRRTDAALRAFSAASN
jgi:tetratricopeptide (TPR) repeat protein